MRDRDTSSVRRQYQVAGWREWVELPEMSIPWIKAKLDTGARTSALHAVRVRRFTRDGEDWVHFEVHPRQRSIEDSVELELPVLEWRTITSSNGQRQKRPVIVTPVSFFGQSWPIELTLTNRDAMGFRMLLGREALRRRLVVDSSRSFIGGRPPREQRKTKRRRAGKRRAGGSGLGKKRKTKARAKKSPGSAGGVPRE